MLQSRRLNQVRFIFKQSCTDWWKRTDISSGSRPSQFRIKRSENLDELHAYVVVIEAIVEDLDAKANLFPLEKVIREDAVLATNTSSLSVTAGQSMSSSERVIGLPF